jgi:hypothetical protein
MMAIYKRPNGLVACDLSAGRTYAVLDHFEQIDLDTPYLVKLFLAFWAEGR